MSTALPGSGGVVSPSAFDSSGDKPTRTLKQNQIGAPTNTTAR